MYKRQGGERQCLFDFVAVGEGHPAGVNVQLSQLEDKIFHQSTKYSIGGNVPYCKRQAHASVL